MTDKVFVDTNVLVYSRDISEPHKQKQAMVWMSNLWNLRTGRLSFQVLQEFYVTGTDKLTPGLDHETARRDVRLLLSWQPFPVDVRVIKGAWHLQDRYHLSWWDALIVSASPNPRQKGLPVYRGSSSVTARSPMRPLFNRSTSQSWNFRVALAQKS